MTYDARGPVMPGGKEGQAGSAARRAREETRPVSALQRETVNVGSEKTSNPQCRPRSELVGLGMTGRLAARLAVAGNCEVCHDGCCVPWTIVAISSQPTPHLRTLEAQGADDVVSHSRFR